LLMFLSLRLWSSLHLKNVVLKHVARSGIRKLWCIYNQPSCVMRVHLFVSCTHWHTVSTQMACAQASTVRAVRDVSPIARSS
jgi:hypothetical protein